MINCEYPSFKTTPLNEHTIAFRLEGEFGRHLNKELRAEIMTALKDFKQNVIIDLTKVDNIDTSAAALPHTPEITITHIFDATGKSLNN